MSGESVFDLVDASEPHVTFREPQERSTRPVKGRKAPPPTASTFGLHGTSAVIGNMGGEFTEPSAHPTKKPIGTFGREVGPTVEPSEFMRKGEGVMTASRGAAVEDSKFKKTELSRNTRKAPIPDRNDRPVMGLRTDKDFVVANAVENILAVPTKQIPGPRSRPTDREDFGKVPEYLQEIKADIQHRRAMVDTHNAAVRAANERWSELSPAEIAALRSGLQSRWDSINRQYQAKGFSSSETPSIRLHQEDLERELSALEFAMQKLGRSHVFVYDDQR